MGGEHGLGVIEVPALDVAAGDHRAGAVGKGGPGGQRAVERGAGVGLGFGDPPLLVERPCADAADELLGQRQALGVGTGCVLDMRLVDGELRISSIRNRIRRVQERASRYVKPGTLVSDELSAERREAAKHE